MPRATQCLKEYQAKRNFKNTPEPSGEGKPRKPAKPPKPGHHFFCVQKPLASPLHYDFRLEHNGVLLSWAVPKGPSLNPADKRLAMHVEDHPLDYGDFEGVIPEGYGAGIVMLWDRGTWKPDPLTPDIDQALRKGELKFSLNGAKLKGNWLLVRTRPRTRPRPRSGEGNVSDESRTWLLIKKRDEWSGTIDIATFAPRSIKSKGDFEDILAK